MIRYKVYPFPISALLSFLHMNIYDLSSFEQQARSFVVWNACRYRSPRHRRSLHAPLQNDRRPRINACSIGYTVAIRSNQNNQADLASILEYMHEFNLSVIRLISTGFVLPSAVRYPWRFSRRLLSVSYEAVIKILQSSPAVTLSSQ